MWGGEKTVESRMADRVRDAVGVMLDRADELGVTRKAIACKAGIEYGTLTNYSHASKEMTMPATRAVQLLVADYIPLEARLAGLAKALEDSAIRVCVDETVIDRAAPAVQLADVVAKIGELGAVIATATRRESDGGRAVTATEINCMLEVTSGAMAELAQLENKLREMKKKAVG